MFPIPYGGFWVLVFARFLQGIAGAFSMSTCISLGVTLVEEPQVPAFVAMLLMVTSFGSAIGPVIGGIVV